MKNTYEYSPKAQVFKKSYDDICLTVVIELPKGKAKNRNVAIDALKVEISNLMNDSELEKILLDS